MLRSLRLLPIVVLATAVLPAQTTAPAVSTQTLLKYDKNANGFLDPDEVAQMNADAASAGGTVAMNPFEVTTTRDRGFQTGSVGTTARLKVDLADTPVSYSIINREFIEALGITNMGEAASWATNQTFLSTDNGGMSNNSSQQYYQRGVVVNTGQGNSTGGQRNSFQNANMINDSFDVETFDFGRGPNAALFGNGNGGGGLGGISSTQTKRVQFQRARTSLGLTVGSWGTQRLTLDTNQPITEKFGARLNLVTDDTQAWRLQDKSRTRGITGAFTWKPTNTTTVTLDASHQMKQAHNTGSGFDEYMSGWDGVTVFRGPVTNAMFSTNATPGLTSSGNSSVFGTNPISPGGLTFSGEANGINRVPNDFYVGDMYTMTMTNYKNYPITRRADSTSRVPIWSSTAPNGMYYQRASATPQGNGQLQPAYGVNRMAMYPGNREGLPEDMMDRLQASSRWKAPSSRFEGTFDTPSSWQWSKDLQLTVTQQVSPHLYLDLSADISRNHQGGQTFDQPNGATTPEGGRYVQLDIDQLTPDGKPNGHFLEPYSTMGIGGRDDYTGDTGVRTNIAYTNLDLGKWGNYNFNLQASASQRKVEVRGFVMVATLNADRRRWANDEIRYRVNWSDENHAYTVPKQLVYTAVDWTNPNSPVIQAPATITPVRILGQASGFGSQNWSDAFDQQRYGLITAQAKYWNNKIVLTGAFRRDQTKGIRKTNIAIGDLPSTTLPATALTPAMLQVYGSGYVPHDWDNFTPIFRPDAPADYFTMTYVNKNFVNGTVINPKPFLSGNRPRTTAANGLAVPIAVFQNDRFRDDYNSPVARSNANSKDLGLVYNVNSWLSPYVNYGTSFQPPSAAAVDINQEPLVAVSAYGYDMGANMNFFSGRLTLRLNYFKNTREHDASNSPVFANINTLYAANRADDSDTNGRNAYGIQDLPGNGDYQSTRSDGREVEIGATVLPGLRTTINGGWGSTTNSSRFPLTRPFVLAHASEFAQILVDAGGMIDTSQKPTGSTLAPGKAVPNPTAVSPHLDQTSAIDAYNNIWTNYESIFNGRVARTKTQPTINVFNDYTIQGGLLRGLRVGAGIQWQGSIRFATGAAVTALSPTDPTTAVDDPAYDGNDIFFLKGSYKTTATFAYTFNMKDSSSLALNLVINNPINDRGYVWGDGSLGTNFGTLRQPEGNLLKPNRVNRADLISRFKEPINFRLSATYSFSGGR